MTEPDEEKGYEVVDKRKVNLDEDGQAHVKDQSSEAQAQGEARVEEEPFEGGMELPPVDVYSLLKSFIGVLGAQAWQWLGLVKNPITGQLEKDLAQAKVAIDTISVLISQMEGHMNQAEQMDLKSLLSDLQINFVQQSAAQS